MQYKAQYEAAAAQALDNIVANTDWKRVGKAIARMKTRAHIDLSTDDDEHTRTYYLAWIRARAGIDTMLGLHAELNRCQIELEQSSD